MLEIYQVSERYTDYLRKYDDKVSVDKDSGHKAYIGVLLRVNGFKYIAPLSSPKEKHKHMKRQPDVFLIKGGDLGVINLNNMIPVRQAHIKKIIFEDLEDKRYVYLLKKQYMALSHLMDFVLSKAKKVYEIQLKDTLHDYEKMVLARSCCFKKLEVLSRYF